ncbi:MAG: shikimate dehydrogenase [Pyrinomonadaceae bacterium]
MKKGTEHRRRPAILVGLIGEHIQASRSPHLHEQEAQSKGIRYFYQLIDLQQLGVGVEALPRLLGAAELLGFAGLNITHPCKQAVMPLLDELSKDAAAIGAVNTVVFANGRRIGHNTDWLGFPESFRRGFAGVPLGRVVLLGAGGAGAAVAYALLLTLGAQRLAIHDIDGVRAATLTARLCDRFGDGRAVRISDLATELAEADGLVQATAVGMLGRPGLALPAELLRQELWVAEVVYVPLETELLRRARALGCRTLDGGRMAVYQAAEAFRLFTGIAPDRERMLQHFVSTMNAER